jgi:hypothetical protein
MVEVIVGYQYTPEGIIIIFNKTEHRLVHVAGVYDDRVS